MNIGIVTPGKISPGVNTCIAEIALREKQRHNKVFGIVEGWRGLNHGFMDEFLAYNCSNQPGSVLHTSREPLNLKLAKKHLLTLDKLYCIGDREVHREARAIYLDDKIPTNLVGITGFGTHSKVGEVSRHVQQCHLLAQSIHGVVFLEIGEKFGDIVRYVGMSEPHADVVICPESDENYLFDVQHSFAMNGHCVVVVNSCCDYGYLLDALKVYNVDTHVIRPGGTIDVADPCVYDNVLCARMGREVVEHSALRADFVCEAGKIHPYAFYPPINLSVEFNVV